MSSTPVSVQPSSFINSRNISGASGLLGWTNDSWGDTAASLSCFDSPLSLLPGHVSRPVRCIDRKMHFLVSRGHSRNCFPSVDVTDGIESDRLHLCRLHSPVIHWRTGWNGSSRGIICHSLVTYEEGSVTHSPSMLSRHPADLNKGRPGRMP